MKIPLRILLAAVPLTIMSMVSAGYASADIGGKTSGNTEPYPYISPTPGEFPIIAWGMTDETSRQVFKGVVDCGFNAVMVLPIKSIIDNMMAALNPVAGEDTIKLSLIPNLTGMMGRYLPDETPDYIDYVLNQYSSNTQNGNRTPISGWMLQDEPSYYQFDDWALYCHAVAQHDQSRMMWVNLYGDPKATSNYPPFYQNPDVGFDTLASGSQSLKTQYFNNSNYRLKSYIEEFCKKFRPGVLSYDYYPFNVDTLGIDRTIERGRLGDFYTALQLYSEISKKRDRPFWAFCQCRATCINSDYSPHDGHPAPTENFLRYEAFNALAFGAQGIEYWGYKEEQDPEKNPDPDKYYALVTRDGKKTPAWYFAKKVNQEIRDLSRIFLGAKLDSYYFVGDPRDTAYCDYKKGSMSDPIYVRSSKAEQNGAGTNLGALVSTLTNGDKHYVIIMNQSPYERAYLNLSMNNPEYEISQIMTAESADLSSNTSSTDGIGLGRVNKSVSLRPSKYQIYQFKPRSQTQNATEQQ